MFTDQIPYSEQTLYVKIAAILTAIDNPITDAPDGKQSEGILPASILGTSFFSSAAAATKAGSIAGSLVWPFRTGSSEDSETENEPEVESKKYVMRIDSEIDILKKSVIGEDGIGEREVDQAISLAYKDFESLLLTIDPDADEDDHVRSETESRIYHANKLVRRYLREADISDMLPATKKIFIFELYSLSLADGQITDSEQVLIKKIAKLLNIEEFIANDLQESAKEVNRVLGETLAIISE